MKVTYQTRVDADVMQVLIGLSVYSLPMPL